ncbi:MAG: hypothetical protein DRG24_03450 [Epsilonproteobacteria bacterium]|nr:MAG: hypothetical protein DRG24_03450 [Campylobacterota bacterium]
MQSQLLSSYSTIRHIFTTRHGDVSSAPYNSYNLAFHVGDDSEDVRKNHLHLAQKLDYDLTRLVHMRQIHSEKIIIVADEKGFGYAVSTKDESLYLDVNSIIKRQLETASVLPEHIEDINLCTSCQLKTFFSYRADQRHTGRMAGVIILTDIHRKNRQ